MSSPDHNNDNNDNDKESNISKSEDSTAVKAALEKLFKSGDSTSEFLREQLFKSGDSAAVLSNLMKSNGADAFNSDIFKSSDSILQHLMNSDSSRESLGLSGLSGVIKSAAAAAPSLAGAASPSTKAAADDFHSRDWVPDFESKHVDVDVTEVFRSEGSGSSKSVPELMVDSKKPASEKGKTDWEALLESKLPAASQPVAQKQQQTPAIAANSKPPTAASWEAASTLASLVEPTANKKKAKPATSPKRKRPPKKVCEPEKKVYMAPRDKDVLLGRGGRTNNHVGNKKYLEAKDAIQPRYMAASKEEKTTISQELVDIVHAWGGHFLKLDSTTDQWYIVHSTVARKKASQSLREINSPEERAAKRARYK